MRIGLSTLFSIFICLSNSFAAWQLVSDFDSSGSIPVIMIAYKAGVSEISNDGGSKVLVLDLSAQSAKRAVARVDKHFAIAAGRKFKLAFDMKIDQGRAGYISGVRFGKPGSFIQIGRYAGANGAGKYSGKLILNDQRATCKQPLNAWLHYELSYDNGYTVLKVWQARPSWAKTPEKYNTVTPISTLKDNAPMPMRDNELVAFNQDPYRVDEYPQNRGIISYDNIYQTGLLTAEKNASSKIHTIKSGEASFSVDLTNGMIVGGKYGDTKMVESCCDEYILQLRKKTLIASEYDDRVVSHSEKDGELTLECRNESLAGIAITKKYYFTGDELCREISFTPSKTLDGFIYVRSAMKATAEFRGKSYYSTFRDWALPTFLPADDIKLATGMGFMGADVSTQMNCIIRPDLGLGLAQYQTRLDGRYIWPHYMVIGQNMVYNTSGWEYPAMCFNPKGGVKRSGEYRLRLFQGDQFNQHAHLASQDYIKKMRNNPIPGWVRDIKLEAICWGDTPSHFAAYLDRILKLSKYTHSEKAVMTLWGWAAWGYFPTKPDEKIKIRSINKVKKHIPSQFLVDQVADIHKEHPAVKYGNYHFLQALAKHHFYAAKHPEWFAYGPDGKPLEKPEPGWTPVHRLLKAPGAIEAVLDGFTREQKRYNTDMFYIDGGSRMKILADWKTMTADQPYEYLDWWKKLHQLAYDNNSAVFFNNNLNPFADMAYLESDHIRKYIDHDWRVIANSLLMAKFYQRPGQTLAILYRKARGDSDPEYTNLVLSMGLTPAGAGDLHVVPNWPELFGYIPYINAAYELKTSRLNLDSLVSPKFWTDVDRKISLQVQTLTLGDALLVSAVNHTRDIVKAPIELDLRYSQLRRDKPVYVWKQKVFRADYRTVDPEKVNVDSYVLPHVVEVVPLKAAEVLKTNRLTLQAEIPEKTLTYYVVSNSPAVVTAINGRPTQFQLPNVLGITTKTRIHGYGRIEIEVDNPYNSAEIKILLPKSWSKNAVLLNSKYVLKQQSVRLRPWQFIVTKVGKGKNIIVLEKKAQND